MKKWLSLLLALVFLCTAVSTGALAADANPPVTRAQWIQDLVKTFSMEVEEDNYPDNYFSDLTGEEAYYRDILVAVEFGVVDIAAGMPFNPEEPATREFAAQTLNYCLGFQLEEATYTFAEAASVTYPDDIQVAINRGWFALSSGNFLPQQPITAEEMSAMLKDAKQILASDVVDENYDSVFTFADGVVQISDATARELLSEDKLVLIAPDTPIAQGDIFVVYFDGLPTVYKADNVTISGVEYTIQVTEQNLNDYLLSVDAEGSMTGNLADFQVAEGMDAIYVLEDNTRIANPLAAGNKGIKSIYFYPKIGDASLAIELTDMHLVWKANGNVFDKTSIDVSAIVYGKVFCSVSVPFGAKASDFTDTLNLGSYPIGSLGTVSVTANISIDGTVTVSYGADFCAGVAYSYANGFRLPHSFKKTHFSLTVEATLDQSITAKVSVYNIPFLSANCSLTVGMKTNFVARYRGQDVKPSLCIHTDTWIYAKASANASVGIDSKLPGAEALKKKWSHTVNIWDRNTSPARSISHHEDGQYVTSCTYGETDFFGYRSTYYTKYGSRYANGGVSAVAGASPYKYTTDENGNATITGYTGSAASLSIPATIDGHTVVCIGNDAFKQRKDLVAVTIPKGVTRIGSSAFRNCTSLANLIISEGVTDIGSYAFQGCASLRSVDLPDSLVVLGNGAFQYCDSLQRVYIPKNMKTGDYCGATGMYPGPFAGCGKLTTVKFAEEITKIPQGLFIDCTGLESIVIPDTVTTINSRAFAQCTNLSSVTLSKNQAYIWNDAFADTALTSIILPETMQTLGCGAFRNCDSLQSVNIPKGMNTGDYCARSDMYPGPFANCDSLNSVTFDEGITYLPNGLFSSCTGLKSITIPDTVVNLKYKSFAGCENLEKVNLSRNLTTIGTSAFADCTGLTAVELPASLTTLGCGAFEYCTSLKSINIPKNMNTGDYCGKSDGYPGPFTACSSLTEITFAKGIPAIPNGLFWRCTGLESITLPATVTNVGRMAFAECTNLKTIKITESVTQVGYRAFWASGLLELTIPDSVTSVGDHVAADCPDLKTITWPAGTTTIPEYAFAGSVSLETVNLPNTVKKLQEGVFRDCDSLKTVILPDSITSISSHTFYDCNSLEQIVIPDSITSMGSHTFYGCNSLEEIVIPNSVTSLGSHTFYGCEKLTKVTLSRSLTSIPGSTFQACSVLEEVTVPYYVTSIGSDAFSSSPKLTKVILPRGLESIATGAFSYPDITVIYGVPGTFAETWANENGYRFVAYEVVATEVKLDKSELTLNKGATEKLNLAIVPENTNDPISWKSSDEKVVTVNDKGEIKAVGLGNATVKVVVGNCSASCTITVVQPVTSISLNKSSISLESMDTFQLTATIRPDTAVNKSLSWSSADPTVATVDANGMVTAMAKGKTTITVETQDGSNLRRTCTVTVTNTGYMVSTPGEMACCEGYPTESTDFWIYTQAGVNNLEVTFDSKTQFEDGFDYLYIYDGQGNLVGKYTGTELSGKTISVPGDTVKIQLHTDSATDAGSEWGFRVTDIQGVDQAPSCDHRWASATCTAPKTCTTCGATEGTAKGHAWKDATCTTPKTCATCGATEGAAKGHAWKEATCTAPKTCTVCGTTSGNKAAHRYDNIVDGTCNACGIHRENVETRKVVHMFRMYNPNTGEHFYTGSTEERDNLIAVGWQYEGVGFTFPANTGAPVHRLFQPSTGEHLYTMDEAEKDRLMAQGWNYEGIAFNSAFDTEAVQHRLHNPNAIVGAYHFTFSIEERDTLIAAGWEYQGIGWYSCWK